MHKLLCQVCGGPADHTDRGILWLLGDYRDDWPGWPEHMAVTEPPICTACARTAIRACPALRKGFVAVRVGHSAVCGVYGARYRAGYPRVIAVEDAIVTFDDPTIRWTCAAHLVRELTDCVIISLDSEYGAPQAPGVTSDP